MKRIGLNTMLVAVLLLASGSSSAQTLERVRYGFATTSISPIIVSFVVASALGYYREEGLEVENLPLGSNAAVMASLDQKRIDFGAGVPSFQVPLVAKGERLPAINYFEYTYPFKWAMAVKPDSPAKRIEDLRGTTIGVSGFGITDYPVGKALMRLIKLDPEKDVQWLAVGEGVTAGQALTRGQIAGLFYFDTGFGQIEAAGIPMRYLPLPTDVPKVGGLYISASRETLEKRRKTAIGFARAVAKANLYTLENPNAAAYHFLQLYPEAGPRASSLEDRIRAVALPISKRAPLFKSYDPTVTDAGRISVAEWEDEITFLGLKDKIKDPTVFYTNELIPEINRFDKQAITAAARTFKVPAP
ncbi:MAG: ABC transporter substrate-binding protein [Burkholderiales bacterium]